MGYRAKEPLLRQHLLLQLDNKCIAIMASYLQTILRTTLVLLLLLGLITQIIPSLSFFSSSIRNNFPALGNLRQIITMDHNAEKPALFSDEDVSAGAHQAILSPTVDSKPEGVTVPPDHPAFIQFTRWLDAFNTVDKQILEEYHSDSRFPYSVAIPNVGFQHLEISLARQTGGFNVVEIVSASSPESLVVVLQAKKELDCAKITIEVDPSKSEYPVTSFMVQLINTPLKYVPENHPRRAEFEKANIPLTAELRRIVVEAVSNEIREQYLDPDSSGEIIEKLSNNLNNGNYEDIEDSSRFAQRLTQDIYLVSPSIPSFNSQFLVH